MTITNIENAIKEVAAKHGIAIGRDDPVLILITIMQMFMQDLSNAQRQMLDGYQSEIEAASSRWEDSAKANAAKILNASLAASKEAMQQEMNAGAKAVVEIMKSEIADKWTQNLAAPKDAKKIAYLNLVAAGMALFASILACVALIIH